jgi:hypothetical protein
MLNLDLTEHVLYFINDYKLLIKLSIVNKEWNMLVHCSRKIWRDVIFHTDELTDKANFMLDYPIQKLELYDNVHLTDEIMSKLLLQTLICRKIYTNKNNMDCIKNMKTLKVLNCTSYNKITDDILQTLNLDTLYAGINNVITDAGIIHMSLKNLYCNKNFTDASIINKPLKELSLSLNKNITDDCVKTLINLEYLNTGRSNITDKGIERLTKLKCLNLRFNKNITDDCIKKLTQLQKIWIGNSNITDEGIKQLTQLQKLWIGDSDITDEGIRRLTKLRYLNMDNNKNITDDCIKKLTRLQKLWISDSNITDEGIKTLVNLNMLCIRKNVNITDDGIKKLPLKKLRLGEHHNISVECINNLQLETLELEYYEMCNDFVQQIKHCKVKIVGAPTY